MKKAERILYIYPAMSTFIAADIEMLKSNFDHVYINTYNWSNKQNTIFYLIHQFFALLFLMRKIDKILISFGGYWSMIPAILGKIFRRPVYIILNGTDCAAIPSIRYGSLLKKPLRFACHISYNYAHTLLPVSSSLVKTKMVYYQNKDFNETNQGYLHFFPKIKTPYFVIDNGVDVDFWKMEQNISKEPKSFITVLSANQFVLKGGDLIIEVARQFPDCHFYFAGISKNQISVDESPENVIFLGKLSVTELRQYYSKSRYFLRLSIYEGFGVSLCEAMLCECVPIVSKANVLPDIIGDSGLVVKRRDIQLLKDTINNALADDFPVNELGKKARLQIATKFEMESRNKKFINILKR